MRLLAASLNLKILEWGKKTQNVNSRRLNQFRNVVPLDHKTVYKTSPTVDDKTSLPEKKENIKQN